MKKLLNLRSLFLLAFTAIIVKSSGWDVGLSEALIVWGVIGYEIFLKVLEFKVNENKLKEKDSLELLTRRLSSLESKFGLQGLRK